MTVRCWCEISISSLLSKFCVFSFVLCVVSGCSTSHNTIVDNGNEHSSASPSGVMKASERGDGSTAPDPISTMEASTTPPPLSLASLTPSYSLQPGDTLNIKFFYNPELNEEVTVRPDGRISLQLVNDVRAASLSPDELVSVLKKRYSAHLRNPEISVILQRIRDNKIYVDGEVGKSGGVTVYGDNMAIMEAIASAGGLKSSALRDGVLLIRRNGLGKPFVYRVDLGAAMDGSDITQNIMLKAHDIIFVPKSAIANVNTWVDLYLRKNIPFNMSYDTTHLTN